MSPDAALTREDAEGLNATNNNVMLFKDGKNESLNCSEDSGGSGRGGGAGAGQDSGHMNFRLPQIKNRKSKEKNRSFDGNDPSNTDDSSMLN
jgi:hypothetical protein